MWWDKAFFALLALGGLYQITLGVRTIRKGLSTRAWPQVPAQVLRSAVHRGGIFRYEPDVRYSYACDGDEWESWRVRLYPSRFPLEGHASEVVARYTPGQTAVAYVNPTDPDEAVLEPGAQFWSVKLFLIGLASLSAGVYFLARDLGLLARH